MVSPRHYQRKAIVSLEDARREGKEAGLLNMATGTGKTLTTAFDIKNYMNGSDKVLFLAHQKEILEQAEKEYQRLAPEKTLKSSFYAGYKEDKSGKVVYATRDKLYNNLDQFDPEEFDYIIVDECHHIQSPTYQEITEHFEPDFLLGLTATPYLVGVNKQDILRELGIEEETFRYTSKEAVEDGWLSETKAHVFKDEIDTERDITDSELDRKIFLPERNQKIVQAWKNKASERKTIAFCRNIEHANRVVDHFKSEGIDAEAIHSDLNDNLREKYIEKFRKGELDVLTGVDMFNEGVDFPDVSCLLFLRPTISRRIFTQQLGRGLRSNGSDKKCLVLDFVNQFTWDRLENQYGVDMDELQENVEQDGEDVTVVTDVGEIEIEEDLVFEALEEYERWKRRNPTTEEVKNDLEQLLEAKGRAITSTEYRKKGSFDIATIRRHYGKKWNDVMREYGYEPQHPSSKKLSEEEAIEMLQKANEKVENSITKNQFDEVTDRTDAVITTALDTNWNDAKKKAGIELDPVQRLSTDVEKRLEELKEFAEGKEIVRKVEFEKENQCSAQKLIDKYGSWAKVLEAIDVDVDSKQRTHIPESEILEDIRETEKKVEGRLSRNKYEKHGEYNETTASNYFGTWVEAKKKAGIELQPEDKYNITKEYILEKIREVDEQIPDDKVVTSDRWNEYTKHDAKVVNSRFSSWHDAREQSGVTNIDPDHGGGLIPKEILLEDLRDKAKEVEGRLTSSYYAKHGKYSDNSVFSRYGSWKEALEDAGLKQYNVGSQEILDEIKEINSQIEDRRLYQKEYNEHGSVSVGTVINRFGSWNNALEKAGITTKRGTDPEVVLEDMVEVAEGRGNVLRAKTYNEKGKYSSTIAKNEYGSWKEALNEAGLEKVKCEWEKEEVLERLKEAFRENPDLIQKEFLEDQPFSEGVISSKFGGWKEMKKRNDIQELIS